MSVNFGYGGRGIMNNNMVGGMMGAHGSGGNTFQEMKQKYGCEHCYQNGPVPYNFQMQVNPLPQNITDPSLLRRIVRRFMGG